MVNLTDVTMTIGGVIEGFYGTPWTWAARRAHVAWGAAHGLTHYVYAPKDDPLHRARWREPYPSADLDEFAALVTASATQVGFAISPGLDIDYDDADDRAALLAKLETLVAVGVRVVCLALDDIPPRPGLGEAHARLTTWLREALTQDVALWLVPTDYTSTRPTPYLDALATGLPDDVLVMWTGPTVVCDEIPLPAAQGRAAALGDRPPLVWDNVPVNDGLMTDRLFTGPLRGRPAELHDVCSGWLANPMPQHRASRFSLASTAAWLRGDDPYAAWVDAVGPHRVLAEACDGAHPRALVRALTESGHDWYGPARELATWIDAAAAHDPGELAEEASPWSTQLRTEAQTAKVALRTLQYAMPLAATTDGAVRFVPPDPKAAVEHAMLLVATWQVARRGTHCVNGARCGFRAVLDQHPSGEFRLRPTAVTEDDNAVDHLVRFVLARVADVSEDPPELQLDGAVATEVSVSGTALAHTLPDGVRTVRVVAGGNATRVGIGASPPLAERRLA